MQAGCNFLVFAHHHSMLEALHEFLKVRHITLSKAFLKSPSVSHTSYKKSCRKRKWSVSGLMEAPRDVNMGFVL